MVEGLVGSLVVITGLEVEVGRGTGAVDGIRLGFELVGDRVGNVLGIMLGNLLGLYEGTLDGFAVGRIDRPWVGLNLGIEVGVTLFIKTGTLVGILLVIADCDEVVLIVGSRLGSNLGMVDGEYVND